MWSIASLMLGAFLPSQAFLVSPHLCFLYLRNSVMIVFCVAVNPKNPPTVPTIHSTVAHGKDEKSFTLYCCIFLLYSALVNWHKNFFVRLSSNLLVIFFLWSKIPDLPQKHLLLGMFQLSVVFLIILLVQLKTSHTRLILF